MTKKKLLIMFACSMAITSSITGCSKEYDVLDNIADLTDSTDTTDNKEDVNASGDEVVDTTGIIKDSSTNQEYDYEDNESEIIGDRPDYKASQYVDLSNVDFDKIEDIKKDAISDEEVDAVIIDQILDKDAYVEATDVKEGCMINIDYTITQKGEEEPYAEVESENRIVGNNNFPQEINDLFIGTNKGDVINTIYEYPEDYDDLSYRGKTFEYEIKVNNVYDISLTDNSAKIISGWQDVTAEEYRTWLKEALFYNSYDYIEALFDMCEITAYPEDVWEYDIQKKFIQIYQEASEYIGHNVSSIEDEDFIAYLNSIGFENTSEFINKLQEDEQAELDTEMKALALDEEFSLGLYSRVSENT